MSVVCLYIVSAEEVEEYIGTMMDQEFDTILEDGSLAQVKLYSLLVHIIIPVLLSSCSVL